MAQPRGGSKEVGFGLEAALKQGPRDDWGCQLFLGGWSRGWQSSTGMLVEQVGTVILGIQVALWLFCPQRGHERQPDQSSQAPHARQGTMAQLIPGLVGSGQWAPQPLGFQSPKPLFPFLQSHKPGTSPGIWSRTAPDGHPPHL